MKEEFVDIVKHDPNYRELVKKRMSLSIKLSLVVLVVYFSFILTIAFKPTLLSQPVFENSVITLGIPVGIFVILLAFILTGVYTYKANNEFDELSKKVKDTLESSFNE